MNRRRDTAWRQLRDFRPQDERERAFLERMCALLEHSEAPFSPEQLNPGHFTASAFVLSPGSEALLMIYHARLARWLQPGGHVDPGDPDLVETARRECGEEVGRTDLVLDREGVFDVDIHTIPETAKRSQHEHFDVRFLFRSPTREIRAGSDALDAKWIPLQAIAACESDASVMRAVGKLLRGA